MNRCCHSRYFEIYYHVTGLGASQNYCSVYYNCILQVNGYVYIWVHIFMFCSIDPINLINSQRAILLRYVGEYYNLVNEGRAIFLSWRGFFDQVEIPHCVEMAITS